jgi:D-beta-D-heptose 7-phosphate kinase / D-beta-D-heptose 1-phosphate adenosyltransferase
MEAMSALPSTAIECVRHFLHLRALVIGDAMLDTYLEGTASRLCSEGPVPVVQKTAEYRLPGGAANTAANIRALEADVLFLGIVGRDIAGTVLRSALRERGVSDDWLVEDESVQTLHKLRILADGQYVVRFDELQYPQTAPMHPPGPLLSRGSFAYTGKPRLATECASASTTSRLIARLEEAYALCDLIVVSDYCYGVLSEAVIERLATLQATHQKPLLIDSKALHHFRHVEATIVTPNYMEASLLVEGHVLPVRHTAFDLSEIERIAWQLLTLLSTKQVAVTLGEHGVFLLDRRGSVVHLTAHPVAHANDVGAGDSFAAAMALSLAAGLDVQEAAQIGIDAASIAVAKRWTAVVQQQELLQRVSLREYASHARSLASLHTADNTSSLFQLVAHLDAERSAGRTIVFTNGVFDILHAGHVQFLRAAKALGDLLVVGINSDSSTRRLKGPGRPINSERDRMALVAALDTVDAVTLFDEDTPAELIRILRPHIHVKGGDYANEALPEAAAVQEVGGRVVIVPLAGTLSTSSMIDRIVKEAAKPAPTSPTVSKEGNA